MKALRTVILTLLAVFLTWAAGTIVAHQFGYDYTFRLIRSRSEIGIPSYDNHYNLVLLTDSTGQYNLFSVIQTRAQDSDGPRTVFVTDDFWYHSRYIADYGWMGDSYDFCIMSSDTGSHEYQYRDGTWIPLPEQNLD